MDSGLALSRARNDEKDSVFKQPNFLQPHGEERALARVSNHRPHVSPILRDGASRLLRMRAEKE
jgi:hypothetical protein